MLAGRWTPENRAALETLLARTYRNAPIAIFDWDGTCAHGDTADLVFHQLCRDLAFDFHAPDFAEWIEQLPFSPEPILFAVERYLSAPDPDRRAELRFELEHARFALHAGEDDNQAWAWDSGAFVGWTPEAVRTYTHQVIEREISAPLSTEELAVPPEVARSETPPPAHSLSSFLPARSSLAVAHGLRPHPEIQQLAAALRVAGWQVYIITASPQWEIEAFGERYQLPPGQVIGMRREIVDGRITATIAPPVSWGDGKLDAYQQFITRERPPNLVAADSVGDWKLLEWAIELALLVNPESEGLVQFARWKAEQGESWLVQAFA